MKATVPYIQQKFREFNQIFFAGTLPELPIELSDAKGFVGVCRYKSRQKEDGTVELYDFKLSINTRIDLPEREIEDTIIHEMIHYFIGVNRLEDSSSHGPMFQHLMKTINEKYGRHVSITHKTTPEQQEALIDKKQHYHVVAVVSFVGGKIGIKVLPRVLPSILNYYNKVREQGSVTDVRLYMSNDIYFNRFPNSAALKVHYVDPAELEEHIKEAEVLGCDGKTITRNANK